MYSSLPDSHALIPSSPEQQERVRAQLERLLHSSHFRNSKRYPTLLRHIVEETLEGRGPALKERTLGVEVFGRPADYDTASDPIVRVTIAEIRKRIAQYYHEDAHASELRIELSPGSYIPEFIPGREHEPEATTVSPAVPITVEGHPETVTSPAHASRKRKGRLLPAIAVAVAVVLAVSAFPLWRWLQISPMDRLWGPFFADAGPVTYCLPISVQRHSFGKADNTSDAIAHVLEMTSADAPANGTFINHEWIGENVVYSDVLSMIRMESVVEDQDRPVRVRLNTSADMNDLREGPVIFIGGLDNQWTLKVLAPLRYRFAGSDADFYYILDAKDPGNRRWAVRLQDKLTAIDHDYAIVARVHSDALGHVVFLVAGIGMSGTAAAGEFLANPAQVKDLERRIGYANRNRDFEAVLKTSVDNGIAGPAEIVALDVR